MWLTCSVTVDVALWSMPERMTLGVETTTSLSRREMRADVRHAALSVRLLNIAFIRLLTSKLGVA